MPSTQGWSAVGQHTLQAGGVLWNPWLPERFPHPHKPKRGNDALAQAAPRGSSLGCPEVSDEVELGVASGLGRGLPQHLACALQRTCAPMHR